MIKRITVVVALGLALAGCTTAPQQESLPPKVQEQLVEPAPFIEQNLPAPNRLVIPKIGVDVAPLIPLALDVDGAHAVPSTAASAGWFTLGPEPGEVGAAIVLGHVNQAGQAGVFARLHEMAPGDTFQIDDRTWYVYEVQDAPKDAFPVEHVYEAAEPEVRLITCGGAFDYDSGHYKNNFIVYARLTP